MKARHCDECKHFNDEDVPGASVCEKNHKPRWYAQKSDNPHDMDYGYKRKCEDYTEAENAGGNMTTNTMPARRVARATRLTEQLGHSDILDALIHAEEMRSALRVIYTWAGIDGEYLDHRQVRKLAAKALHMDATAIGQRGAECASAGLMG